MGSGKGRRNVWQKVAISICLHLVLVSTVIGYCVIGAVIFKALEQPYEVFNWVDLNSIRLELLDRFYKNAIAMDSRPDAYMIVANDLMWTYENTLLNANVGNYNKEGYFKVHKDWSFKESFFYCFTIITTLGYGIITPSSTYGRLATIIYVMFGFPLMIIFLKFTGSTLTRLLQSLCHSICSSCRGRKSKEDTYRSHDVTAKEDLDPEKKKSIEEIETGAATIPIGTTISPSTDTSEKCDRPYCCPIFLGLIILFGYMGIGASLFSVWAKWTYFESFHLVFICLTTIGYGDLISRDKAPEITFFIFVYLLAGYILVAACYILIYEMVSKAFRNFGTLIGLIDE